MTFLSKSLSLASAGLIISTGLALAQAGGADVPTDAKKQGTMENGPSSTGMSKSEAGGGMTKKKSKKKHKTM